MRPELIDLNGMIDHQIDWNKRIDAGNVTAEQCHRGPHRCQIDHRWHAGEVLQQDASWHEREFKVLAGSGRAP